MHKIKINPLFTVIILLAILSGQFQKMVILLSILLIHELGHYLAALIFSWRIISIELLPFGGVVTLDEHSNKPMGEEVVVLIMGPLFQIIHLIISFLLLKYGFISTTTYSYIVQINKLLLLFNLLPIWPLDGGKMLFLLQSYFFPFKLSHQCMLYTSLVSFLVFVVTLSHELKSVNGVIFVAFILYSIAIEYKNHEYVFNRFILSRYLEKPKFKKNKIILNEGAFTKATKKFYRTFNNVVKVGNVLLDESIVLDTIYGKKSLTNKHKT